MIVGAITFTSPSSKAPQKSGSFPPPALPASTVIRPCPTPADAAARSDVEAATLAPNGSPDYPNHLPTCRAHYPGGSSGCACRLLPPLTRPSPSSRRVGICIVTFEMLRLYSRYGPPDRSVAQRRPLSRGSNLCGYPHKPLVSYRINRQLSGWNLPPLMIRAFGAHCQLPD
jgi:hypothetical protein